MLVSEFIASVRQQAKIAVNVADSAILRAGDQEVQGSLLPAIRRVHGDYLVREASIASVNGRVAMPARAVAATVRLVQLVQPGGAVTLNNLSADESGVTSNGGTPAGFYFDGQDIVLLPRGASGTVRVLYYVRPGRMVAETDVTNARAVTGGIFSSDGSAVLSAAGTIVGPTLLDVVSSGPAHAQCALDITNPVNVTVTVPAASAIGLMRIGDYVCTADRSPFVPLPEELASALVHRTAAVLLQANGYKAESAGQADLAAEAIGVGVQMLAPRSEGNPRTLRGGLRSRMGLAGWLGGRR